MQDEKLLAFEHAPTGLVVTRYRLIGSCNTAFASMFGYTPDELAKQSIALLYPSGKEFADVGRMGLEEMLKRGVYHDSRIMRRRNGTQFWCRVHGRTVTPKDPYSHCVWSFVDLDDERPVVDLSRRERAIAMLIAEGLQNKEIAARLDISHRTVESHRSRMMHKLKAKTSAEMLLKITRLPI